MWETILCYAMLSLAAVDGLLVLGTIGWLFYMAIVGEEPLRP